MIGPLSGIRVIDAGRFLAGPVTATLLAEFGADVIKIERPGVGDDLRRIGWLKDGKSLWWAIEGRNKRSITLDLSQAKGGEILKTLLERSDVLVENFRPGTLEKWGLAPDELLKLNPKLVLLRTSGFGQTGPYSRQPAFDSAGESLGGLRYLVGEPDRPPARPGVAIGDYLTAIFGAVGVLIALYERDAVASEVGQVIDNALYESVMRVIEYTIPAYQHLGRIRERIGSGTAGTAPAGSMRCRDNRWVSIGAANDRMYERLCIAIGDPNLVNDRRFVTNSDRVEHRDELHDIIAKWALSLDSGEVTRRLVAAEVSVFPVYSAADIVKDPHVRMRESVTDVEDPAFGRTLMQNVVPRLSRTPGSIRHAGPALGSSNEEVYCGELGMSPEELAQLRSEGVV